MKFTDPLAALPADQRALLWQVARYGITGLGITAMQALVYWTLATFAGVHPQLANLIGYVFAVVAGYVLHSRFTFRGHGDRDQPAQRGVRFILVSLVSLALNALWVQLLVGWLMWPTWTPVPLMLFATPALVFTLNRRWVFR